MPMYVSVFVSACVHVCACVYVYLCGCTGEKSEVGTLIPLNLF